MTKRDFHIEYVFFPAGQGLFAAGRIGRQTDQKTIFTWVYDCGTSSESSLVNDGISRLAEFVELPRIDLVAISHFDNDHISGIVRLIEKYRIGTLLLPYMPLAQRLVLAFEERVATNLELMKFFVNPVSYLTARGGPGIDRILFVFPSTGDGPPIPVGEGGPPPDDMPLPITPIYEAQELADVEEREFLLKGAKTKVEFLLKESAIKVGKFWEFVPYNDDPKKAIAKHFLRKVAAQRSQLTTAVKKGLREKALDGLKALYDRQFGRSSENRNIISLHLYAGPKYGSKSESIFECYVQPARNNGKVLRGGNWYHATMVKCSILYTGDGYHNTQARLNRLLRFLRNDRMKRLGVFQVMHHGSKKNWHEGVAEAISPLVSVFSSDPERKDWRHPDAVVLRDFWQHGPIQVDKNAGAMIYVEISTV